MMTIADNLARVQDTIAKSCAKVNRSPDGVKLIAISKRKPVSAVLEAIEAGVQHFGENRVEEAIEKIPQIETTQSITWHMVGHIQSRKAKLVTPLFDVVQSVDSVSIARKLAKTVAENTILRVLVQVNVSGEASKSGLSAFNWQKDADVQAQVWQNFREILETPQLQVLGLMTMAPIVSEMEQTRAVFADLSALRQALADDFEISLPELSMGMTDDFPIAIQEGATMVRVGRAIFGERK